MQLEFTDFFVWPTTFTAFTTIPSSEAQVMTDGPRNFTVKAAAVLPSALQVSVLADPRTEASIIPGWPTNLPPTKLAIENIRFVVQEGLEIYLWWDAPTPVLIMTLSGRWGFDFRDKGFLQNDVDDATGAILISSNSFSGSKGYSLIMQCVKQGAFG